MDIQKVLDKVKNALTLPVKMVMPIFSMAIGYTFKNDYTQHNVEHDPSDDVAVVRKLWGAHIAFGGSHTESLYYNGIFFFRFNWPFGVFVGIRWAGKDPTKREFWQAGFGYKLNGTFALTFRIQSDASAERGTNGPNWGQARGWDYGTK